MRNTMKAFFVVAALVVLCSSAVFGEEIKKARLEVRHDYIIHILELTIWASHFYRPVGDDV